MIIRGYWSDYKKLTFNIISMKIFRKDKKPEIGFPIKKEDVMARKELDKLWIKFYLTKAEVLSITFLTAIIALLTIQELYQKKLIDSFQNFISSALVIFILGGIMLSYLGKSEKFINICERRHRMFEKIKDSKNKKINN